APVWFALCWLGYTWYADGERPRPNLTRVMHAYRTVWAQQMLGRDNRMVDTQIIANLMRSASFFASTAMFIIAGLIAVLGAREQAKAELAELPVAQPAPKTYGDGKVLHRRVRVVIALCKVAKAFQHIKS